MKLLDLNHLYFDGRHYDRQSGDYEDDIPFYVKMARTYGGPILELACGTGRIAIPMAKKGFRVVGIDAVPNMLERAKKKSKGLDIEWIHGDARDFDLHARFDLILFPFNSFAHLHDLESIAGCLTCVRKHLKSNGRFIIDMFNPRLDILTRNPEERFPQAEYDDPDGRGHVVVTETSAYDRASQVNHVRWHYQIGDAKKEIIEELNLRIFFPQELDALLQLHGFEIDNKFGDFNETPFDSDSENQVVVCRKR